MRATLLESNPDIALMLPCIFKALGIPLNVVGTVDAAPSFSNASCEKEGAARPQPCCREGTGGLQFLLRVAYNRCWCFRHCLGRGDEEKGRGYMRFYHVIVALLLANVVIWTAAQMVAPPERVYTVAELQAALAANPTGWQGRTVTVRGEPVQLVQTQGAAVRPLIVHGVLVSTVSAALSTNAPLCTSCVYLHVALVEGQSPTTRPLLFDTAASADPLRTILRLFPLLRSLAPEPQAVQWGTAGVYRLQILIPRPCGAAICADARLLDARAGSLPPLPHWALRRTPLSSRGTTPATFTIYAAPCRSFSVVVSTAHPSTAPIRANDPRYTPCANQFGVAWASPPTQSQVQAMVRVLAYLSTHRPTPSFAQAVPMIRTAIEKASIPATRGHACRHTPKRPSMVPLSHNHLTVFC